MSWCEWMSRTVRREVRHSDEDDRRREEEEEEVLVTHNDQTQFVYFVSTIPDQRAIDTLNISFGNIPTYTDENQCVEYLKSTPDKFFLIIDGQPSATLIEAIESLKNLDSVFFYSLPSRRITSIRQSHHSYQHYLCENINELQNAIRKSREEFHAQLAAFSACNQKEKAVYNLSKERSSFLYYQLFKYLLKDTPKTHQAKQTMMKTLRNYYRGNSIEVANIEEFDRTYCSSDAIVWFTKDIFLSRFINKILRTQDFLLIYSFRFYMLDLSEQIEFECQNLKEKQPSPWKIYRAIQISEEEMTDYQNSVGNVVSNSDYLLATCEQSIAYEFLTRIPKQEGIVRVLVEYSVDSHVAPNIIIADIRRYSASPDEYQFLVDTGTTFQIDSCENLEEDIWEMKLHAVVENNAIVNEYIEYYKKKIIQSNLVLSMGTLFLEMGQYREAEAYFDDILNSSNPSDEEIACLFYNFGRTHRLKGDFNRAINCYNRAYQIHTDARPTRPVSAGKSLNGLGVVYSEQGRQSKAEECFQRAMDLYRRNLPEDDVDVAGTLINQGIIDCNRKNVTREKLEQALKKFERAKKIYENSLPLFHPNQALPRINIGNVHVANGNYSLALEEYQTALKIQQASLPDDHTSIARTLHNLAIVYAHEKDLDQAKIYLERAKDIVNRTYSMQHPLRTLLDRTHDFLVDSE